MGGSLGGRQLSICNARIRHTCYIFVNLTEGRPVLSIMLLLIYLVFLLCIYCRRFSPGLLLISIYLISLICGLLIGNDHEVSSLFEGFNLLFLAGTLTMMLFPWTRFSYKLAISEPNLKRLHRLTLALLAINGIVFFLFATACYHAFTTVTDYSAFKNEGESMSFFSQLPINHTVYLLAIYLHSTSFFLVPLHFYYLTKKKYLISTLCLIFSFNIVLNGLSIFSRSTFLLYFVLYLFYLPFFYVTLESRTRNIIKITGIAIMGLLAVFFVMITENRFGNVLAYTDAASSHSFIKSPELYSLVDYASQWFNNYNEVMADYRFETLNGEISFPFFLVIADKLDLLRYAPDQNLMTLQSIWGDHYSTFNGLIADLVFDFGYFGAALFVLLYSFVVRFIRPVRAEISLGRLLVLGVIFTFPAMGIFNSLMRQGTYHIAIWCSIVLCTYMSTKKHMRKS